MNFSCDRTLIYEAFNIVSKSVPQKSALPVLLCFLIDAQISGEIVISGFDLDLGITTTIEGEVIQSGKIAVDAKLTLDMIRNLEAGKVTFIENDNKTVNVFGGSSEFILPYLDGAAYPERPAVEAYRYVTADQRVIHSMIRQTLFAVAQSDVKTVYTGALFDVRDGRLSVVCTDTFRFGMRREPYESDENFSFVVQGKVLGDIIRIMRNEEGEVRVGTSGKHTVFEFGSTRVISRVVDGVFLNYENLTPKSFKYSVKLNTKSLKRIAECASVLINGRARSPIRLCVEDGRIFFSCRTPDGHSFDDEIPADVAGDGMEIGLNNKTLLDVLNSCESEEIVLNLNSRLSAVCFTPAEGDGFLFLVAPMRLGGKSENGDDGGQG